MKIGLIDIDHHNFPNLAQMKLSAYHKSIGDDVEWCDGLSNYDRVYISKVFTSSTDYIQHLNAEEVIRGGTGYAIHGAGGETYNKDHDKPLPYEIEHIMPDYSIYSIKDKAYGFLTRGCPRGCNFCIVGKKEGLKSVKVADVEEFWNGQRNIVLLDPNILACRDHESLLDKLAWTSAWIDITQGLDARLLTDANIEALNNLRMKEVHFAWDRYEDGHFIIPKFERFAQKSRINPHNRIVYVLTNYDTTHQQDLERIYTLRSIGFYPYVMIYDKDNAPKVTRRMQRWCNNRFIFASCPSFSDYQG